MSMAQDLRRMAVRRLVSDKDVHDAVDFLQRVAFDIGKAKGRLKKAERKMARTEAMMFKASSASSAEARKADAKTTPQWQEASDEEVEATIDFETLKAQKEGKEILIEVWRTESASLRGTRL